jgi:uncharacterized protein involved in exopolysaccharide biosynthesis
MATREIAKRDPRFPEPEGDTELILEAVEEPREKHRTVAQIGLLWEHRPFLLRCAAIGLVAAAIIAFLIPVRYSSTTRLMPPDQGGSGMASMLSVLGKVGGGLGLMGGDLLGLKTSGDLFVGVLQSRTVQDDVVNKFDLRKVYGTKQYESARKQLASRTEISADRKSGIITITVSDHDPQRAAALGAEYVEALNRVVTTQNTSSAHKERAFLEERLNQVQQNLEGAEKDFSQFASQNTAIDVKEQGKAMITAAAELEGQLIAAETELEGLRQIYTESNVRVRSVQARIDEYKRQLLKMDGKIPAGADGAAPDTMSGRAPGNASSSSASSGKPGAGSSNQDLYPSIRQLPLLGVEWSDLYRRTKVLETVFETLTEQYELAKVEEARETPSVKVLDPADLPERKSYPPRTLLALLGACFALGGGCVWILAREYWQKIDPQDPGKMLAHDIAHTITRRLNWKRRSAAIEVENENVPKSQA